MTLRARPSIRFRFLLGFAGLMTGGIVAGRIFAPLSRTDPEARNAEREQTLLASRRVMVVFAHPDDCEFYAGGTLKALTDRGATVTCVVVCEGDKGPRGGPVLARTRIEEQRRSARILGVKSVRAMGYLDGDASTHRADIAAQLAVLVREFRPDSIIGFDPDHPLRSESPDHAAVARSLVGALRNSGGPKPEGCPRLYLTATSRPNTWVDVTRYASAGFKAFEQHHSQFHGLRLWLTELEMRAMIVAEGRKRGTRAAETFRELDLASRAGIH